jgi:cytidylate kinase
VQVYTGQTRELMRFICSDKYRIKRLAEMLCVKEEEVKRKLDEIGREQRDFFKRVYELKNASPYEFDMVIDCDYIKEPRWATEIVAQAFKEKFSGESIIPFSC